VTAIALLTALAVANELIRVARDAATRV